MMLTRYYPPFLGFVFAMILLITIYLVPKTASAQGDDYPKVEGSQIIYTKPTYHLYPADRLQENEGKHIRKHRFNHDKDYIQPLYFD